MYKTILSKILWSYFWSSVSSGVSLNGKIVTILGSKMSQTRNKYNFALVVLNSAPYPQINSTQVKCMKWSSPKTFEMFQAPTLALPTWQHVLKWLNFPCSRPYEFTLIFYVYLFTFGWCQQNWKFLYCIILLDIEKIVMAL